MVVWIIVDTIYTLIVCPYFHKKIKYRLFALRDSLRTVRIENPSMSDNVFRMMELRINGCIGLVQEASFLRVVIALCTDPPVSEKEKLSAIEMQKAVQWIKDNRETEIGKQLFDIDRDIMHAFCSSFVCNSPFITQCFRYVIRPVAAYLPKIAERFRKTRDYFMQETVPAIMVYVAR